MKALNLHGIGDLRFEEVELPARLHDEATIKIKAVGICGSDIPRIFTKGTYHFPTIPGHEFAGIVTEADDPELIGKHVTVFPLLPCMECDSCQVGNYELCDHYDYYGSRRDGAFAEYLNVKLKNMVFLPENVSFAEAAMCEPVSVALHALRQAGLKAMDTVAIWGIGPIGLILAKWASLMGAKDIVLIARDEQKADVAARLGFRHAINSRKTDPVQYIGELTHGKGADVCAEGTGNSEPFASCLKACKKMGTVVCMGNPLGKMELDQDAYWAILRKQLRLVGTWNSDFNRTRNDWQDTIAALADGKLELEPLITHKFALSDYEDAFRVMRSKEIYSCKIMFVND